MPQRGLRGRNRQPLRDRLRGVRSGLSQKYIPPSVLAAGHYSYYFSSLCIPLRTQMPQNEGLTDSRGGRCSGGDGRRWDRRLGEP